MMNTRNLSILALALWVITILALVVLFIRGNVVSSSDERIAIELKEAEKQIIAREMRSFLVTLMKINEVIAQDQLDQVADLAVKNGMAEVEMVPPPILAKLPLDFKKGGMEVHKKFDHLVELSKNKAGRVEMQNQVSAIMAGCIACHAAYKIVTP